MQNYQAKIGIPVFIILLLVCTRQLKAQDTHIKGFVEANTTYQDGEVNFGFGERIYSLPPRLLTGYHSLVKPFSNFRLVLLLHLM